MHCSEETRRALLARMGSMAFATGATLAVAKKATSATVARNPKTLWSTLLPDPDAVMVGGTVQGERLRILIDTGSAMTVVDAALAKRLGLASTGARSVRGDVGSVTLGAGSDLSLDLGGTHFAVERYLVTDFAPIFGADGGSPNVILGIDPLRDAILAIDFTARRLAFLPRDAFRPWPGAERFAVTKSLRGQLSLPIVLEGHDPVAAAIDLGSSNPLTVTPALAEAQTLMRGRRISSAATGGIDGLSISRTISVATLRVGRSLINDVPCEVLAKTDPTLVVAKLGLPVFERFLFALDVAGQALWLKPEARRLATPFRRDLSGLGLAVESGHLRVVHVAQGGPAALAGWREGEIVVAVDGVPIGPRYASSGLAQWRYGPAGGKAVLSLSDGSTRTLVLRRYY